ncbi:uncharacterized protein [Ptychodera flava]|uniref:uncharacterized protein n=1 Tax=Ptychodera flava TaxID=63121 RepID=UPI003969E0FA
MYSLLRNIITVCLLHAAHGLNYTVHEPLKDGAQVALIIVPGAFLSAGAYTPLARELQRRSPFQLWVGVTGEFKHGLANIEEIGLALDLTLRGLQEAGMQGDRLFVAGHSLGGAVLFKYLETHHDNVDGLILWASIPRDVTSDDYQKYPIPTLRLSGDLDGVSRISKLAESFDIASSATSKLRSPVCLLSGVNHGQFASGPMPPNVALNDLRAEVSQSEAHQSITRLTTLFMVISINSPAEYVQKSKAKLSEVVDDTMQRLFPLKVAKSLEQERGHRPVSTWSIRAQEFVLGAPRSLQEKLIISNTIETNVTVFVKAKPAVEMDSLGDVAISTVTYVVRPKRDRHDLRAGQSADSLNVKMKCQESVRRLHSNGDYGNELSCQEINKHAFDWALMTSSQQARDRYHDRGKPMVFQPDFMAQNGSQWLQRNLTFVETTNGTTEVTSSALVSDPDFPMKKFAGMHYCKLLSPYRAMEWIYTDSLRDKHEDAEMSTVIQTPVNASAAKDEL